MDAVRQPSDGEDKRPVEVRRCDPAARAKPTRTPVIPAYRTLPRLARDPLAAFREIGIESGGRPVRLSLGLFKPYLVIHPDHVQRVLRDNTANYPRDGMLWKPLRRLNGNGIASDGERWEVSRGLIQPLFAGKNITRLLDRIAEEARTGVAALGTAAREGAPLDASVEMNRIVNRILVRAFFGGRIATNDAERLGEAIKTAFASLGARLMLPFMPESIPLPGDAAFRRATRVVDEVMIPLVASGRDRKPDGEVRDDIVSLLCAARGPDGESLTDTQIRDDVVAMFVAGAETTALALTWLWVVLDNHPEIAARLYDEVEAVVGAGDVGPQHLPKLRYTKMVLSEVLRLYPLGWMIPRSVAKDDVIGGRKVRGGSTVLISPYLTHRMPEFWDRPEEFDPERFAPERDQKRHRFAYYPFGGGGHVCLGSHLFTVEAQLIVAAILSRFRPHVTGAAQVKPQASASLRPSKPVELLLRPIVRP